MKLQSRKAFNLAEVIVAVAISTAVLAGVYETFIVGNRTWMYYSNTIIKKQDLRRAAYAMANELREAKDVFIIEEPGSVTVNFMVPLSGLVSYTWSEDGDEAGRVIRTNYKQKRVLANNITALSFEQPAHDCIYFHLEADKKNELRLSQKVALRHKTGLFRKRKN